MVFSVSSNGRLSCGRQGAAVSCNRGFGPSLPLPEQQVDDPAPPDGWPGAAVVAEELLADAPAILQRTARLRPWHATTAPRNLLRLPQPVLKVGGLINRYFR